MLIKKKDETSEEVEGVVDWTEEFEDGVGVGVVDSVSLHLFFPAISINIVGIWPLLYDTPFNTWNSFCIVTYKDVEVGGVVSDRGVGGEVVVKEVERVIINKNNILQFVVFDMLLQFQRLRY